MARAPLSSLTLIEFSTKPAVSSCSPAPSSGASFLDTPLESSVDESFGSHVETRELLGPGLVKSAHQGISGDIGICLLDEENLLLDF
jgi:hypothetical protein